MKEHKTQPQVPQLIGNTKQKNANTMPTAANKLKVDVVHMVKDRKDETFISQFNCATATNYNHYDSIPDVNKPRDKKDAKAIADVHSFRDQDYNGKVFDLLPKGWQASYRRVYSCAFMSESKVDAKKFADAFDDLPAADRFLGGKANHLKLAAIVGDLKLAWHCVDGTDPDHRVVAQARELLEEHEALKKTNEQHEHTIKTLTRSMDLHLDQWNLVCNRDELLQRNQELEEKVNRLQAEKDLITSSVFDQGYELKETEEDDETAHGGKRVSVTILESPEKKKQRDSVAMAAFLRNAEEGASVAI